MRDDYYLVFLGLIFMAVAVGLAVGVYFWFHKVLHIMRERKNTVEIAASQLEAQRSKADEKHYDSNLAKIIGCCENAYQQAETIYNQSFAKPWIWLPAVLMGFRKVPPERFYTLGRNWQ